MGMLAPSSELKCDWRTVAQAQERRAYVGGAYWWTHAAIRVLFSVPSGEPVFCATIDEAIAQARSQDGRVIAWASRLEARHQDECAAYDVELIRIEDGFIRSVGLGAGFAKASSLAVDTCGIYYDATRPSGIEKLLQDAVLSDAERSEGAQIRRRIVDLNLSKYNLRSSGTFNVDAGSRPIILVPGQVADDASIMNSMSSTIDVHSGESVNLQLLRLARERNPDAYIVYKPHPDVLSGLRKGHLPAEMAQKYADLVVSNVDITTVIEACDGIETISSLAGYEGLLHDKRVVTHGVPFYSGWGLTTDLTRTPRRTARRTLDELTFIAFALYTRHVHPITGKPCSILALLDALHKQRASGLHEWRNRILHFYARMCERAAMSS
jgi:capsular polysaccharide export protein